MITYLHIALKRLLAGRVDDESGATAVEYGLMLALIAVAIIAAVTALGFSVRDVFGNPQLGAALS